MVGQALSEHRSMNAVLSGNEIQLLRQINVGVAVDSERGLVVPVIRNADAKSVRQIAEDFAGKVEAIMDNTIGVDALTGGTFTVTNLGMLDVEQFVPVINPPECGILAIGAMKKEFVPDAELNPMLVTTMKLTLVFDHRIVDGAPAARFLQSIKRFIECPDLLI
jgi:pyruvate dehydrogenase E2 component (dihydrolipoamide acetyltransferase)